MRVTLVALMASVLLFSPLAFAAVNPNIQLVGYSMSPSPLAPGQSGTLTIILNSTESDICAEKVSAQLSPTVPLFVDGPDIQYIDPLCTTGPNSNGTFTFPIHADSLAAGGTYTIPLSVGYQKSFLKFASAYTLTVRVQGQPSLDAHVVSSTPADVYAGDSAILSIRVSNSGSGRIDSATARLSSNDIDVKWAGAVQQLGQIKPRSSVDALYSIDVPKNLSAGTYPADLTVTYVPEDGLARSDVLPVSITVKPKAEFEVSAQQAGDLLIGDTRQVSLVLKNTGSQDARKLKVNIRPVYPFSTDGTTRYVETLAAGSSVTLDYAIAVDKEASGGEQVLEMDVNFEDPQGKSLSDSADFSLDVRGKNLLEVALGFWYLIVLAALVAAFIYRRRLAAAKGAAKK